MKSMRIFTALFPLICSSFISKAEVFSFTPAMECNPDGADKKECFSIFM